MRRMRRGRKKTISTKEGTEVTEEATSYGGPILDRIATSLMKT